VTPAWRELSGGTSGPLLASCARLSRHGLFVDFIDTDVRSKEEVFPSLGVSLRSVSKSTVLSGATPTRF
jgi:hypothetical protein